MSAALAMDEASELTWLVFRGEADFAATYAAERALAAAGFSVGIQQRGEPRGILFGSFVISKWRNLRPRHRAALHAEMSGDGRTGPITVRLRPDAPPEARLAFQSMRAAALATCLAAVSQQPLQGAA